MRSHKDDREIRATPRAADQARRARQDRSGLQKGAQRHAEGEHGEKTHHAFMKQLHSSPRKVAENESLHRRQVEAAYEGKRRLVEDRQQHDEAEITSERTRLFKDHRRGRDVGPSDNLGNLHGVVGSRESRADYKARDRRGLPADEHPSSEWRGRKRTGSR